MVYSFNWYGVVVVCYIAHRALQYLIYVCFGLEYSYINPFALTIHGLKYKSNAAEKVGIEVGRVKLHFSVFRKRNSHVNLSISDVVCDLTGIPEVNASSEHSASAHSASGSKDSTPIYDKKFIEKLGHDRPYDPKAPVVIFPEDKKLKRLTNFLIKSLPHLSFVFLNSKILLTPDLSVVCEKITGKTDINSPVANPSFLKRSRNLHHTWASSLQLENCYLFSKSADQILSKFIGRCETSINFKLDLNTGVASSLKIILRLVEIEVSVLYLLKLIKAVNPKFTVVDADDADEVGKSDNPKSVHKYRLYFYGFVFRLLKHASVSIQTLSLTEIPATTTKKINKFLEKQDDASLDDVIFVAVEVASSSLEVGPVSPNQVGYSLKFVEGSLPLQWIVTLGNIKLSLNYSKIQNYTGTEKEFDIMFIPNLLFTLESTMLINLLRVVFDKEIKHNFTKKQTISVLQLTVANPSMDVSTEQLSILLKAFKERKVEIAKRGMDTSSDPATPTSAGTSSSDASKKDEKHRKDELKKIILNTSPKFQIKLLLEKPLLMIKSENGVIENRNIHLSTFQPSMLSLQFEVTAIDKGMDFSFRCDIPDTSLIYQRDNLNRSAVTYTSIKDSQIKVNAHLFDLYDVSLSLELGQVMLDLNSLEVLNGLSILYNSLLTHLLNNKPVIPRKKNHKVDAAKNAHESLFNPLPDWFSHVGISLNNIILKIGSKSLFIPPDELLSESNTQNNIVNHKIFTPSSVTYSINKVDIQLKNQIQEGESDDSPSTHYSEYSKSPEDYYWTISGKVVNSQILTRMLHPSLEVDIKERILQIPEIDLSFYCLKNGVFELSNFVTKLNISHSVSSHFTIFSSFYLLKNALSHHKSSKQTENTRHEHASKVNSESQTEELSLLNVLNIKWFLKEAQIKVMMPQEFSFRLDLFDLKGFANTKTVVMEQKLLRLAVKKYPKAEFYNCLLTLDNMRLVCLLPDDSNELMKVSIHDSNIKISIPSNFIVHSLFDAIILTAKLTKKFIASVKEGPSRTLDKTSPTGVVKLPNIKLKSESLAFMIDDDPFEAELNMIFQLGLLEQRARLEKYKCFNQYLDTVKEKAGNRYSDDKRLSFLNKNLSSLFSNPSLLEQNIEDEELAFILTDCGKKLHKLRVNISKSWIMLIKEFKLKRHTVVQSNMEFLSANLGSFLPVSSSFNSKLVDFNENPSLMGLYFHNFTARVRPPKFENDSGDALEFMYRVGKGVPKDTEWDKVIPMRLILSASEVRVHLRDFPLPLAYIPNYRSAERWSDSFVLKATLVFSEPMPKTDKEYMYLPVPMYFNVVDECGIFSWQAPKTTTSVKCYYECECIISSDNPTMVTWSTAYQAVMRQLNICFDTFSKPTSDPSPKLGIWDKMRNILHGYVKINWKNDESEVRLNILNSYDPYKILGYNAGFTLVFKKGVEWMINDPHRKLERDYFIFRSKSILFGIPNHLSQPLPCWCSKNLIFLPSSDENLVLSSMYGYYLDQNLYVSDDSHLKDIIDLIRDLEFETHNICLNGDIELTLSMIFERKNEDGTKSIKFKPHYENILTSSDKVKDKDNFDSYKGFRSDYIHMALKLSAKASTYNVLRLTPRSIFHFIGWFKQFSGDIGLPIRNGTLWAANEESVKLGGHLMTFKFMFDVAPLYIFHGYRIDLTKPDNHTVIGLKAKIANFRCDLHQRKEKKVKHVDFLDQSFEIMKMSFYIGKVDLDDVDLRIVGLKFEEPGDKTMPIHKFEIFDDDQDWVDLNDYEEVGLPAIANCDITGQIHPLSYASHFCYWMNMKLDDNQFGNEDSHDCCIDAENFPKSKFQHIFDTDKLKFKWHSFIRNLVFEYLAGIEFRAAYVYSTSYTARKAVVEKLEEAGKSQPDSAGTKKMPDFSVNNAEEFDYVMRSLNDFAKNTVAVDHMLLRFRDVQLQMMVSPSDDHLVLFRTQHNEIEIVSLMDEGWVKYLKSADIAKRFGTIFKNADLLMMSRKEYASIGKKNKHYGSTSSWPAFLDGDEPENYIKSKTLLSDVLIYFVMEKASNSYAGGKRRNKLYLNIPTFETRIDSDSYLTFFKVAQKLMMYVSPQQKHFAEMVESLALATEDTNKRFLLQNLEALSHEIRTLLFIHKTTTPLRCVSNGETYFDPLLRQKCSKLFSKALILSKLALQSSDSVGDEKDDECFMEWVITASNINIDFVDNKHTFMNFAMKESSFSRLEMLDKSTINEISIKKIQIGNKDYNILYPELLTQFVPTGHDIKGTNLDSMVKIMWEFGEKVGGMHNIKNVEIECHPMKISMEDKTGLKLMHFLFPDEIKYQDSKRVGDSSSDEDDEYSSSSTEATVIDSDNEMAESGIDKDNNAHNGTLAKEELEKTEDISKKKSSAEILSEFLSTSDESREELYSNISKKSSISFVGSQSTKNVKAENNIISTYSQKLNKSLVSGKIVNTVPALDNLLKANIKSKNPELSDKSLSISEMSERAKTFFSIRKFSFADFVLNVTFSGKGKLRLINVNNLTLMVPAFQVSRKLWTSIDMINAVKKHVVKTLLKQTGRLLRNKMFVYKSKKRVNRLNKAVSKR